MSKHVPLHHRHQHHQQPQAAAASAPPQEDSLASLDFDEAASFDGSSVADVSVTSSIFSQSFAGSIHQGLSRNRAKSSAAAGSGGSGRSSKRGGANDSSRSNLSSDSRDSARSWSSNPNSGNGSPTSRRTSHSSSSCSSSGLRRQSSSSRGKRLRIRFHPKVQCQVTLPRSSYTPQEKEDTWYSSQDGKVIQKDILLTVQTMRALHSRRIPADRVDAELTVIFGEERTDRGLEHMRTARSVENRRRHKASVSGAVLDEQSVQWDEGLESGCREGELRIAEASMVLSRLARDDAARKGRRDARFVLNHSAAEVDSTQGLDKNFEKMAVERAAVRNAQRESQSSSSSASSSRRSTLTRQDATTGAEWTTFGESSNAFSGIKRELSKEVENPNDCCDASNTKATAVPALRSKPKSHMGADVLRRMRLAQLASLSSEASPAPSPCSSSHSRTRSGSESSADHQEDRKMSAAPVATRQPMPRLNDLRAHGA